MTTSRPAQWSEIHSTQRATDTKSVTSQGSADTEPSRPWASSNSASKAAWDLAEASTWWPAPAKVKAHALPMPLEAPVIQMRRGVLFVMLSGGQEYGAHHHALFSQHVMPGSE